MAKLTIGDKFSKYGCSSHIHKAKKATALLKMIYLIVISPISSQEICIGVEGKLPDANEIQLNTFTQLGIDVSFNYPFSHLAEKQIPIEQERELLFHTDFYFDEEIFQKWLKISTILPQNKVKNTPLILN